MRHLDEVSHRRMLRWGWAMVRTVFPDATVNQDALEELDVVRTKVATGQIQAIAWATVERSATWPRGMTGYGWAVGTVPRTELLGALYQTAHAMLMQAYDTDVRPDAEAADE
jgi:hypothetical protein